jgi:superfamily II DNA or RNA helicase
MIQVNVYNDKSTLWEDSDTNGRLIVPFQEALRNELSYVVPSAEWSVKYKQGQWDGRISIYNRREQSFPTGLVIRVKKLLDLLGVEYSFVDKRSKPTKEFPVTCDFGGKQLRDYQVAAGDRALKFQRGMLSLCTGAGKTMTSCYIFSLLQVKPVVFIVPAIELLNQTQREFEKYLKINNLPLKVGVAGGGKCNLNFEGVNVVTYQTALIAFDKKYQEKGNKLVDDVTGDGQSKPTHQLQKELDEATKVWKTAKSNATKTLSKEYQEINIFQDELDNETVVKKKEIIHNNIIKLEKLIDKKLNTLVRVELTNYKKTLSAWDRRQDIILQKQQVRNLIEDCQAFIIDEAHLAAVVTEELGKRAKHAFYKLGLSATPWRTDNQEIRIEGTLGRKIIEVSASDLIEQGYLVKPKIFMCHLKNVEPGTTYPEIYSSNIVNNWERNYRIKQFAEGFNKTGRPTLILVERREHGHILESMIEDSVFVPGGDKGEDDPTDEEKNYRRRMLNATENNEIILIATQWANVGVDAPKISSLILAGSNQSSVTTYQQAGRVLRCVGKDIEDSIKNGKSEAIIVDFYSEHKNLKVHSNLRKRVYKNERAWEFYELK